MSESIQALTWAAAPRAADDAWINALVGQAQAGDAAAFGGLYDLYAPRVYRFLVARVHEPADAEDLLQQVFIKVVEALPRYQVRGMPWSAWLFRIARNVVVDFVRADRHTEPIEHAAGRHDERLDPAAQLELAGSQSRVRAALDALTPEQRDVVIYRFFADLSISEIALVTGKREGAIRALQFRALGTLRTMLAYA